MTYKQFVDYKFSQIPGDTPWNSHGFKNDYTNPAFSEMSAHMPLLKWLASQVDHVTEFGTRGCASLVAFLEGKPKKVVSYDIQPTPEITFLLEERAKGNLPCEWEFRCESTVRKGLVIDETDILFIDTLHVFKQIHFEMLQANRVRKYILAHDSASQRLLSIDVPGELGVMYGIEEFLENNKDWEIGYEVKFNHGLLLLQKKKQQ